MFVAGLCLEFLPLEKPYSLSQLLGPVEPEPEFADFAFAVVSVLIVRAILVLSLAVVVSLIAG